VERSDSHSPEPSAADTYSMGRSCNWHRLNARSLDRRIFGPVVAALGHNKLEETFLLHLKFVSRNHPRYRQNGMWAVVAGTTVVRRRSYWFKAINEPPTRWANWIMRQHVQGVFEREAAEQVAAKEGFEREWREAQAERRCRSMEDEVEADSFWMWFREYRERPNWPNEDEVAEVDSRTSPAQLEEMPEPCPLQYEDDRKKRHRSVINYHLPPAYDELPSKLVPLRRRTSAGMLRRMGRRRGKRRREGDRADAKVAKAGAAG
jgi:hypothetical protein